MKIQLMSRLDEVKTNTRLDEGTNVTRLLEDTTVQVQGWIKIQGLIKMQLWIRYNYDFSNSLVGRELLFSYSSG